MLKKKERKYSCWLSIDDAVYHSAPKRREGCKKIQDIYMKLNYVNLVEQNNLRQGWPNFLDSGPFSEIWAKARATPHDSIFQ